MLYRPPLFLSSRRWLRIAGLTVCIVLAAGLRAGDASKSEPEKIVFKPQAFRPYKDIPEALFYENFEHAAPWLEAGKVAAFDALPGGHSVKLEPADWGKNDHFVWLRVNLAQTELKIPSSSKPAEITVQFALFSDEGGEVTLKFIHVNGDYAGHAPVPKTKTWGVVTMKLSDLRNDKTRVEADKLFTYMEIQVKPPKSRKDNPTVYVDDVLVTLSAKPDEIKPRVLLAEKKRSDMERSTDHDGFAWSMQLNDTLKDQFKARKAPRKKSKDVLVAGSTDEQTGAWVKNLTLTAAKGSNAGYTFHAARDPGTKAGALGGLPDMRLLLSSNLQGDESLALLFISTAEALAPGRPADAIGVVLERTLDAGTVPVVVVPAPESAEQLEPLAAFAKALQERCAKVGVPVVDAKHVLANAKGEVDAKSISPVPPEKLAALILAALRTCHDSLARD